jgi:hypothetical protein
MTSERKTTANRNNSRRSSGPRTAAGKAKASRNAVRHGLAAIKHSRPGFSGEVERLAEAICDHDNDPVLLGQARIIANNALVLRAIREQHMAVIERLREPTAIALAKRDNGLKLATARFLQAWLANREIQALVPKVLEKYKDQLPPPIEVQQELPAEFRFDDDIVPIRIKALLQPPNSLEQEQRALDRARRHFMEQERDEYEALEEAVPDLVRLERYERRAWSRHKRAIRTFANMKLMRALNATSHPQPHSKAEQESKQGMD